MSKPYKPSELLEFVTQAPPVEDGPSRPVGQTGLEPPEVVVIGFKVAFADLMLFTLKLLLAAIPVISAAAVAVYLVLKYMPKLL